MGEIRREGGSEPTLAVTRRGTSRNETEEDFSTSLMSLVLSPRSAPATASCFPRHALPRRHSVLHRSAPSGHHPRLGRTILCHHDGGTLWIKLRAGSQQVRILRVLMPHEGFFMIYIITITLRCALAQPSHLPLLPAPMTPALHCSPRPWHDSDCV